MGALWKKLGAKLQNFQWYNNKSFDAQDLSHYHQKFRGSKNKSLNFWIYNTKLLVGLDL